MAVSKQSASQPRAAGNKVDGAEHQSNARLHTQTQDGENRLNGSWVASEQVADWLHQFQRTLLQSFTTWNETLTGGLTELRKAESPVQMLSAGSEGLTRLFDTLTPASEAACFDYSAWTLPPSPPWSPSSPRLWSSSYSGPTPSCRSARTRPSPPSTRSRCCARRCPTRRSTTAWSRPPPW